ASRLRITRRGRLVVVALALLVVLLPGAWRAVATAQVEGPSTVAVTVQPGDTLWGIASAIDPGADPRGLIAEIREVNGLTQSGLVPGQQLQVPTR
ncbi:MAG: LysM peptidoglycan-binding domain-containing protein, partial [Candidatus Nanopelagicales bacterium]